MFKKKHFFVGVALCVLPLFASAKTPYGMAGCGLGSQVVGPHGNQVFGSTTNQSSANQSFGITSGTSNCLTPSKAAAVSAQQKFIYDNYALLAKEMAQGDGEALRAFSNTFGCSKDAYGNFASQMQNSYSKIFSAPGSVAALNVVQTEIKGNAQLSHACSLTI
ncbi:MAG: DUF3015 family protein [Bdellovibrionota bacterium]